MFFQNIKLRYKIQLPLIFGMALLALSFTVILIFSTNHWLEHTLPSERDLQRTRSDAALLSATLREYILTYDATILSRAQEYRNNVAEGLALFKTQMLYETKPLLPKAGENFLTASDKVIRIRVKIQEYLDEMQRIEELGSEEWRKTRQIYEKLQSGSSDWQRIQDSLADLGAAAEYYHFTVMNSVWTIRSKSDIHGGEDISHHFKRGQATFERSINLVDEHLDSFIQEHEIKVLEYAQAFISEGTHVAETSAELWEAIGELEQSEMFFDDILEQANKSAIAETTRVVSTGRTILFLSVLTVFLLLTISFGILASRISAALEELARGAFRFGLKNLSHRVDEGYGDEVGNLARAFNAMADNLEHSIHELNRAEAEVTRKERVAAHEAGKADMATTILHNVGNILNSVLISTQMVEETVTASTRIKTLARANENLLELEQCLVKCGEMGSTLIRFYPRYLELLREEDARIVEHIQRISTKVTLIRDVIHAQQDYAETTLPMGLVLLSEVVDDVLILEEAEHLARGVQVEKYYETVPPVLVQRNKLTQILLSLLRNACEAMVLEEKRLSITINSDDRHGYIRLSDTGEGIRSENIGKLFQHGFSTKGDGNGFGLHSAANAVALMNGKIWAESEGPMKGATFVISLPLVRGEAGAPDEPAIEMLKGRQ